MRRWKTKKKYRPLRCPQAGRENEGGKGGGHVELAGLGNQIIFPGPDSPHKYGGGEGHAALPRRAESRAHYGRGGGLLVGIWEHHPMVLGSLVGLQLHGIVSACLSLTMNIASHGCDLPGWGRNLMGQGGVAVHVCWGGGWAGRGGWGTLGMWDTDDINIACWRLSKQPCT